MQRAPKTQIQLCVIPPLPRGGKGGFVPRRNPLVYLALANTVLISGAALCAAETDFRAAAPKAISATVSVESRSAAQAVSAIAPTGVSGVITTTAKSNKQGDASGSASLTQIQQNAVVDNGEVVAKGAAVANSSVSSLDVAGSLVDLSLASVVDQEVTLRSGTIVSADGLVVTSDLPAKVEHLEVTLVDGRKLEAKLLVRDERFQLSLLKVEAKDLAPLEPADGAAAAGQPVLSCAAVDGKARVVSSGIVSATDRIVGDRLPPLIQTDVRAGEAGAGGPLVDAEGRLVGIVLSHETAGAPGTTFVVPAEHVRALLKTAHGDRAVVIERPQLGVQLEGERAVVEEVVADSPAAKAGIEKGDVIVEVANVQVATPQDVVAHIVQQQPGAEVRLRVRRGEKVIPIEVTLSPQQAQPTEFRLRVQQPKEFRLETIQPGVILWNTDNGTQLKAHNLALGAIRVLLDAGEKQADTSELVKNLEEMIQNYQQSDAAKPLLEELQSIIDRQNRRNAQDQRVEELIQQVDTLRQSVESLAKQLDELSKTLKSDSK